MRDALAERNQQRGARIADLLLAAAAEATGLAVLPYDHDFHLIADVTGRPVEWIVPAGMSPDQIRTRQSPRGKAPDLVTLPKSTWPVTAGNSLTAGNLPQPGQVRAVDSRGGAPEWSSTSI